MRCVVCGVCCGVCGVVWCDATEGIEVIEMARSASVMQVTAVRSLQCTALGSGVIKQASNRKQGGGKVYQTSDGRSV